jgi:hypothetical protein
MTNALAKKFSSAPVSAGHLAHGPDKMRIECVIIAAADAVGKVRVAAQNVHRRKQLPISFAMQRDQLARRDIAADAGAAPLGVNGGI